MSEEIRIEYKRPPFYRRVFANLIDIILVALCFFSFFIGIRSIVTSNSSYKEKVSVINKTKKECGLFIEYQGHYVDVVTYLNAQKDFSSSKKIKEITSSIDNFLEYSKANLNLEDYEEIKNDYYTSLTSDDIVYDGVKMFVKEDGLLKENELCKAPLSKYYEVYSNYVDSRLMTYLSTKYIAYFEATKYMSNMVLFLEIPVAYVLAGLVVYLLPPLIFKRGRRTVGKALYGVGLVNKDCLNLSGKQFAIRFVIFYFAIYLLSIVTLGIPMIISFTLMAFSKGRQGFADYMLNFTEIDMTKSTIYNSLDEIKIDYLNGRGKPIDFKMEDRLEK